MRSKNPSSALLVAVLAGAAALTGCRVLVPYDSEFACAKSHDYGKCMDVQSAYDEARTTEGTTQRHTGAQAASSNPVRDARPRRHPALPNCAAS